MEEQQGRLPTHRPVPYAPREREWSGTPRGWRVVWVAWYAVWLVLTVGVLDLVAWLHGA